MLYPLSYEGTKAMLARGAPVGARPHRLVRETLHKCTGAGGPEGPPAP